MGTTSTAPGDLAQKASFVFRGTVQRLKAATLNEVKDTANTAVVLIDQIIQAPPALAHYTGREITVHLAAPVTAGQTTVFYANPWIFGNEGVAVRSLGHQAPGPEMAAASAGNPVTNLEDRDTRAHFESASLIASGTVVSVRLPADSPARGPSEHDPEWQMAEVTLDHVFKGNAKAGDTVLVQFPASHDRIWHRTPKLKPGDKGHFVLHVPQGGAEKGHLLLLHAHDFEPESKPGQVHRNIAKLASR